MGRSRMFLATPEAERFWSRVTVTESTSECWTWNGHLNHGYPNRFTKNDGSGVVGHRYAFEFVHGKLPPGMEPDHLCRNRACCNPYHMEAVTHKINTLRGTSFVAKNASKTHCLRGHALTPENVYVVRTKVGVGRRCRVCHGIEKRERIARGKAAA